MLPSVLRPKPGDSRVPARLRLPRRDVSDEMRAVEPPEMRLEPGAIAVPPWLASLLALLLADAWPKRRPKRFGGDLSGESSLSRASLVRIMRCCSWLQLSPGSSSRF